eukprot:Anaeramoba_flamelloidesa1067283_9.p2 GENE.a1067283_9~~a1067283_9.p2  ORF type:complete len:154 (-),score=21.07 a1067283_9:97-558(-)
MKRKRNLKGGPDPIDRYVGSRVRARRVGLRLSQTMLGEAIGVTFQQIQKYENGSNRIGASNLFKIARALGVDVAFFYEGVDAAVGEQAQKGGRKGRKVKAGGLAESAAVFERDPLASREAIELMHNYYRVGREDVRKRVFLLLKALSNTDLGD